MGESFKLSLLSLAVLASDAVSTENPICLDCEAQAPTLLQSRSSLSQLSESLPGYSDFVNVAMSWETGTLDSGLAQPLKPSFGENKNGWTPPKDPQGADCINGKVSSRNCWPDSMGKRYVGSSNAYLSVEKVNWAKDGDYVLKVFGNGWSEGRQGAFRSELSAVQNSYIFDKGYYQYFSMSFWLDESWDQVGTWSTLIAQWKMSPGHPHACVRMSNEGDYKVYFKGDRLWKQKGALDTKHGGNYLGVARRKAWNDIKIFFKKSRYSDGFVKVWFNGDLAFEHNGPSILKDGRGYTKFGMYTNIMGKRTIYFDSVSFCHSPDRERCLAGKSLEQWVASGGSLPSPASSPAPSPTPQSPAPTSAPQPSGSSEDGSWTVVEHKKVSCRGDGSRLDSPTSVEQCRQKADADGMNAFNARYKDGNLKTCYFLSCEPNEIDDRMRSVSSSGSETWAVHYLYTDEPTSTPSPPDEPAFTPSPPENPGPSPSPQSSPNSQWEAFPNKKARCRNDGPRVNSPSSLDQCRDECGADGNAFNARFKDGSLRTCYCLSCEPGEIDENIRDVAGGDSETWEVHSRNSDALALTTAAAPVHRRRHPSPPPSDIVGSSPPPSQSPQDSQWKVVQHKKLRCRRDGNRIDYPSSVEQCQQQCAAEGMNAFNARFKDGSLRACYLLSCDQKPNFRDVSSSGSEIWEVHWQ